MKINKKIFYLIFIFSLMTVMIPLTGCFSGSKEKGFNVYFASDSSLIEEGNYDLFVEYGQFTKIEDYIIVKEIANNNKETEVFDYTISCPPEVDVNVVPGRYTIFINYKDFNSKYLYLNITYPKDMFNIQEIYVYGEYTLPMISEQGVTYKLYYSASQNYNSGKSWKTNTTISVGEYYAWAEITKTDDNTSFKTNFYAFKITPKIILKPVIADKKYTYNGEYQTVEINNYDPSVANYAGFITAKMPFSYPITITPFVNYAWEDGTTEEITLTWTIDKIEISAPHVEGEYFYEGNKVRYAQLSAYDENLINVDGVRIASSVGVYSIKLSIKNPQIYEFEDGSTEKTITWEIKKKQQTAPSGTLNLKIKKASNINDIVSLLPESYYLYNEDKLPFEDNITWQLNYEQTSGTTQQKYYVSSKTTGLHWVKKETYLNGNLTSTYYYQEGNFKDASGEEEIYLTYNEDRANVTSYVCKTTVQLEEKTTGHISLDIEKTNFVLVSENNYTLRYNKNTNIVPVVCNVNGYKVYYKNLTTHEVTVNGIKDVGLYEIWAEILETEDLYNVKTDSIFVEILEGEVTQIKNISVSQIEYLQSLEDCVISGSGYYLGEVEGTFAFKNPELKPIVADSNSTEFEYIFTPNDTNIKPYNGETKIVVNKGKLIYSTPTLNGGLRINQGTLLSEIEVGNDGIATNSLGSVISGKWELTSSTGYLHSYSEFVFTPNDENYETKTIQDNNSKNRINTFNKFTITTEPTLKVAYKSDGKYYAYIQGGKAQISYSDSIDLLKLDLCEENFRVSESSSTLYYYLKYAGSEFSCGTISRATTISSYQDFKTAIASAKQEIFLLNRDISLDSNLVATAKKIIILPKYYSIKMNSYSIDFSDYSLQSAVISHGEITATNTNTSAFQNLYDLYNYGDMNLANLTSVGYNKPVIVKNEGTLSIGLLKNIIDVDNYSSLEILSCVEHPSVQINNFKKTSILNISSEDYFSIEGENYGSIVINSDTFISRKLTIRNGASFIANEMQVRGIFTLEEKTDFKANVVEKDGGVIIAYVSDIERFVDVLKFDSTDKEIHILSDLNLQGVDNIINGDSIPSENQVALKIFDEVYFANDAVLDLGGKTLVMDHTAYNNIEQYLIRGEGKICNGKIMYNVGTLGSPRTETDVVCVEVENIEYINGTQKETFVKTFEELRNLLKSYNGRDINITLTDSFEYKEDFVLNAPTRITIPKNITFTIGELNYLTFNLSEDGKYPSIIKDGTFKYTRKPNIIQYQEDYNKNGFYVEKVLGSYTTGNNYYRIIEASDFATLKTLSKTTTLTVIRVTNNITLEEDITLSTSCRLWISGKTGITEQVNINMNGHTIICSYEDIDSYATIVNPGRLTTTSTGFVKYTQNAERLSVSESTIIKDSVDVTSLSSKIKAECTITAYSSDEMTDALRYSRVSTPGYITTFIYMQTFYTLTSNLSVFADSHHKTHLYLVGGHTFNLGGHTLELQYVDSSDFSKIYVKENSTLKNGFVKYKKDTPYETTMYVTVENGSITEDINYWAY